MPTWLHPPSWATSLGWVFLAQGLFYFPLLTLNMFLLLCVSFLILVKLLLRGALISRIPTTAFYRFPGYQKIKLFSTAGRRGRIAFYFSREGGGRGDRDGEYM